MLDQLLPAVGAALLARAAGGSLAGLARPVAWWPAGLLAIGVELALVRLPGGSAPWLHWIWVAALATALVVVLRNLRRLHARDPGPVWSRRARRWRSPRASFDATC